MAQLMLIVNDDFRGRALLSHVIANFCSGARVREGGQDGPVLVELDLAAEEAVRSEPGARYLLALPDPAAPKTSQLIINLGRVQSDWTSRLTERQREIMRHLCAGRSNKEIARLLGLSPWTVRRHVSAILTRLEVGSRSKAARLALGDASRSSAVDRPG